MAGVSILFYRMKCILSQLVICLAKDTVVWFKCFVQIYVDAFYFVWPDAFKIDLGTQLVSTKQLIEIIFN